MTITVTSRGYPEEEVLREIYAHALEAAGFEVKRRQNRMLPVEELEKGQVSGYPDHLETALAERMPAQVEDVSASPTAAYREARAQFAGKGIVPLPPAPFGRTNTVGILRKTAQERDIETLSDLKRPSREMSVLERELYCHIGCLETLEHHYGIAFETFSGFPLYESPSRLYRALRAGKTDAAIFVNTEGRLARERDWLVLLEDEQHRFPASNALWMTRQEVIEEAGPDYEKAILKAQRGLTLEVMRQLDAKVELDGKRPSDVAVEYLKSIGYKG